MKDRKPIRLIASDLDGTLYYGARELGKMTPANRDAIVRWTEAGHRFLIATGRRACTRAEIIREYAIDCDIIACNGAKVIDVYKRQVKEESLCKRKLKKQVMEG